MRSLSLNWSTQREFLLYYISILMFLSWTSFGCHTFNCNKSFSKNKKNIIKMFKFYEQGEEGSLASFYISRGKSTLTLFFNNIYETRRFSFLYIKPRAEMLKWWVSVIRSSDFNMFITVKMIILCHSWLCNKNMASSLKRKFCFLFS